MLSIRNFSGQLSVIKTTDEDLNVSYTFTDEMGHVVLTRQMKGSETHDTYYVYDDKGNLCFVLQPMYQSSANLDLYAFQYKYDGLNRCIWKKLPGAGYVEMVYDNADRLVFSQDGNQRALTAGNWTYYKYDSLNRLTEQGVCTNKVTTSGTTVHIRNYYDSYSFIGTQGFPASKFSNDTSGYGKGLLTGRMVAGLGTSSPVWKAWYYDVRGREVKRVESNAMSGYDVTTTTYSFTDKPLTVKHTQSAGSTGSTSLTEVTTYAYDSADRLQKVQHKLDSGPTVTLAEYGYDNFGRLNSKKLGGTLHTSTYAYNLRSWLTGISGSKFSQTLTYNNGSAGYNGNITAMDWTANGSSHRYTFAYDGLNRLTAATHGAGQYTEKVTGYDKNGNILSLQRYGQLTASTYGLIDNLTFTLAGNRPTRVDDAVAASAYNGGFEFKDGVKQANEYVYDANGNLTKDLNKGISSIQYNVLNLPMNITFASGGFVQYGYTADGIKRRMMYKEADGSGNPVPTVYCCNVVYENGVQKLLLTEEGYVTLSDGKYHYYLKDHQGNNRVVINQSGTVEEANHYYPFGGVFASSGNVQPYKYNGKEFDAKKGLNLYDYGARHYDAALGRFATVDPSAENYFNTSLYAYCGNNPISRIDPTGADWYEDKQGNLRWQEGSEALKGYTNIGSSASIALGNDNYLNFYQNGGILANRAVNAFDLIASSGKLQNQFLGKTSPLSEDSKSALFNSLNSRSIDAIARPIGEAAFSFGAGEFGGILLGKALGWAVGKVAGKAAAQVGTGEFTYTKTAARHFSDIVKKGVYKGEPSRPYMNSSLTIQEIMQAGKGIPDATFKGGLNWKVPGAFRGAQGIWELGINPETKVIYHFNFTY